MQKLHSAWGWRGCAQEMLLRLGQVIQLNIPGGGRLYQAVGYSPSGLNKEHTTCLVGDQMGNAFSGTARTTSVLCQCGRCCVF